MIGLIIAIIIFNFIAFRTNKRLTKNQILHIWLFTIALQGIVDLYIDSKYSAYWYFEKGVDWTSLPALTLLIPPINMMFLNWYPFGFPLLKRVMYYVYWVLFMLTYEMIALLPEPWGYFHYGWWSLCHSAVADPLLLMVVLNFYKWVRKIEEMN